MKPYDVTQTRPNSILSNPRLSIVVLSAFQPTGGLASADRVDAAKILSRLNAGNLDIYPLGVKFCYAGSDRDSSLSLGGAVQSYKTK